MIVEDGPLDELIEEISPYKDLVVEYYDENFLKHPKAKLYEHEGNVAKYHFKKEQIGVLQLIQDFSKNKNVKDLKISEPKIDDIIRVAYHRKIGEKE